METYSWYNVTVVLFAAFGSLFTGYSFAVFAFTLGQPTFFAALGLNADPTSLEYSHTTTILGAANGVFFGAGFCGCFLAGWAGNRLGRVAGFRIAATVGVIGGALEAGSQSVAMFLVARAVAGFAAGHTMAAMPTYFAEVSPPQSRGLITGAHGVFINVGYMTAGWTGFGCYFAQGTNFAWRFPFAMVTMWALCLLGGSFFVPESPRFLVQTGRNSEAFEILVRLHHNPADPSNTFARQELDLIESRAQIESDLVASEGKWRLFKKPNRFRLLLAVMIMVGGMNLGPLVINNYNVLLYDSLGVSATTAILLSAVYNTLGFIIATIGSLISDRLGRRKAMLIGYSLDVCIFTILTACLALFNETTNKGWAAGAMTMIYVYVINYNTFVDLNQFTIATEIFPTHIRTQASAFAISGLFLTTVLWLNLLPTATASIGWKFYLVFICLAVVHTIFLFVFLPETVGWHLEEMDHAIAGTIRQPKSGDTALGERMAEKARKTFSSVGTTEDAGGNVANSE